MSIIDLAHLALLEGQAHRGAVTALAGFHQIHQDAADDAGISKVGRCSLTLSNPC